MVATGPSLTAADAAAVAEAASRRPDLRVVAISDAYRLLPLADVLYSCDAKWWTAHDGAPGYLGPSRWIQSQQGGQECAARYGLNCVLSTRSDLPSFDAGRIGTGSNSGFQAVNLAALMGATTIVLLGFDMGLDGARRHFFGEHPPELRAASPYPMFVKAFTRAAPLYAAAGVTVLNASRRSALKCFRQTTLESIL